MKHEWKIIYMFFIRTQRNPKENLSNIFLKISLSLKNVINNYVLIFCTVLQYQTVKICYQIYLENVHFQSVWNIALAIFLSKSLFCLFLLKKLYFLYELDNSMWRSRYYGIMVALTIYNVSNTYFAFIFYIPCVILLYFTANYTHFCIL